MQWLFKLYDKDMNGEISQDELEDVFLKMCKIVEKTEIDHLRKHNKLAEKERQKQKLALEKARERELKKSKEEDDEKAKVSVMYSERKKRLLTTKKKKPQRKKVQPQIQIVVTDVDEEEMKRDKEKVRALKSVVDELCQPHRDCKKFDPVKRAKEIFNALDANNDGMITEDEFLQGCKSDAFFMKVIDEMSLDFLWSNNQH